jgi:hypothetical protein
MKTLKQQQDEFRKEIATAISEAKAVGFGKDNVDQSLAVKDLMDNWMEDETKDLDVDSMEIILQEEAEKQF